LSAVERAVLSPFHDQGVGAIVATAVRRDRDPPRDSDYVFVTQLVGGLRDRR
jgi:hypothetical protein